MTKNFIKTIALSLFVALLLPMAAQAAANEPSIIGMSSIVMDMDTGEVIYSKNDEDKRSPASTNKLLTSLIFAENTSKSDLIPYTDESASLTETTLNTNFMGGTVKAGDTMTADDVMKAVMIYSANDASIMMADYVAGSVDAFASKMNEKAAELGAKNSHFINPNGLEVDSTTYNYTTAYDLALIATEAYKNEWIRDVMALDSTTLTLNGSKIFIDTRNKILGQNNNVGGKTGTETLAGHCFVGFFNKDGRNLVTVVLGSEYGADGTNVFNDTKAVADYGYAAEPVTFDKAGTTVGTVDLSYKLFRFFGPTETITADLIVDQDVNYYENDFNKEHASITYTGETNNAWKAAGNKETDLTLSIGNYNTTVKGKIDLSTGDILKANLPIYLASLLFVIIVIVIIIFLIRIINLNKRRSRRRRY